MKVKEVKATSSRLTAIIDLELPSLPSKQAKELKSEIGEYLREQVSLDLAAQKSPVSGQKFPALSKNYASYKKREVGNNKANLDFSGDMQSAIDFTTTSEGIEFGVFGADAPKADGHNNFSGDSDLPLRQFVPNVGEGFTRKIQAGVDDIIRNYVNENMELDEGRLKDIESKADLYEYLREVFEGASVATIRANIATSENLSEALDEYGLLEWL